MNLVQVLPKGRFGEMISFEFHLKNRHEKTQKPLWFLGFQPRYLFRCYLLVAGEGLEPAVLYFLCGENTAVGSAALTVHRTVLHYRPTLRVIRPRAHNPIFICATKKKSRFIKRFFMGVSNLMARIKNA